MTIRELNCLLYFVLKGQGHLQKNYHFYFSVFLLQLLQVQFSNLAAALQISISQTTIHQESSRLVRIRAHLQPRPSPLVPVASLLLSCPLPLQWGKRTFCWSGEFHTVRVRASARMCVFLKSPKCSIFQVKQGCFLISIYHIRVLENHRLNKNSTGVCVGGSVQQKVCWLEQCFFSPLVTGHI